MAADPALVTLAADTHGALPGLVALCGSHGWEDLAAQLAGQADWTDVAQIDFLWSRSIEEMPRSVRIALVNTALTEREPRPKLSSMPEWEQREVLERLAEEETTRHRIAWSLLQDRPDLWASLAQDGKHVSHVRQILLAYPDELPDEVLIACLPIVTGEYWRDAEYMAGAHLRNAADHVRCWPRLRQIAAEELHRVVTEAIEIGWQPVPKYGGPEWDAIAALAELSDDTQLLATVVTAIQTATPPRYGTHDSNEEWFNERATAVAALAMNAHVSRSDLIALLPALDERALEATRQHSEGELKSASLERLAQLRQAAEDARPKLVDVPEDDELAELDDPAAVLQTHLKHLKGRAAQRT